MRISRVFRTWHSTAPPHISRAQITRWESSAAESFLEVLRFPAKTHLFQCATSGRNATDRLPQPQLNRSTLRDASDFTIGDFLSLFALQLRTPTECHWETFSRTHSTALTSRDTRKDPAPQPFGLRLLHRKSIWSLSCFGGVCIGIFLPLKAKRKRRKMSWTRVVSVAIWCAAQASALAARPSGRAAASDLSTPRIPPFGPASPVRRAKLGTLSVPEVGMGTIMWATDMSIEGQRRVRQCVERSMELGLNFFDSAERYGVGDGERLVSEYANAAHAVYGGRKPIVATKFTPLPWRQSAESVVEACRASLDRLGVEQIDLYQIHMPDIVQPGRLWGITNVKDELYWEGLAECYREGLIKNVGVSNYGPTLMERCQEALGKRNVPLASNQVNFSLLYRGNGAQDTIDRCLEVGVKPMAYYPLCMGLLTGKYTPQNIPKGLKGMGMKKYIVGGIDGIPKGGVSPLVRELEDIADSAKRTPAQVALNWVICKGAIPLPGATCVRHVDENAMGSGWRLSPRQIARLDEATDRLGFDFEGAGFKLPSGKFVGYGVESWTLN
eukprot:scaffold7052_cov254-Pinguiococcus_pyrenoidosus.AAC.52